MEVTITLNGKKAEGKEILTEGDEVKCFFSEEIWCSLIFAENINVFPSKEDVKPETAGFAAFYWMENQCFPAAFQSDVHQEEK